jgi:hypothetical protein
MLPIPNWNRNEAIGGFLHLTDLFPNLRKTDSQCFYYIITGIISLLRNDLNYCYEY